MCGVDHLSIAGPSSASQLSEQIFPDPASRPTRKAIVDRRWRSVDFRTVGPAATALQHMHNAADHAAIVLPLDAANIRRQVWFDPFPLFVAQPE